MCRLFTDYYRQFDFIVNDPEEDAKRRGLAGAPFDLPSQQNLQALFDVIYEHARHYLGLYYENDAGIRSDPAVCSWLDQLNKTIPNGVKVSRSDVTFATLVRLIARFIYLVSVQHEMLGTFLWNYQLWTHRQPARVYKDGGREPLDVYQRLVNANFNLNVTRTRLMDDFSRLALDDAAKQAFVTFRTRLDELQSKMEKEPWTVWKIYPEILEANINA
jgi:arachidonate 15-lipoxygenase